MRKFIYLGFLIASNLLSSCASLDSPFMGDPIVEDYGYGANAGTYGVIPSRQIAIMSARDNISDSIVFICAEPAVDLSDTIVSSQAPGLKAKGPAPGTSGVGAYSRAQNLSPTAKNLFEGVQLYRDGMYRLCQAKMNGVISDNDFSEGMNNLLNQSVKLITAERPYLSKS